MKIKTGYLYHIKDVYVNEKARERYFVYSKGRIESIHDDAAIAVKKAYELRGNLFSKRI